MWHRIDMGAVALPLTDQLVVVASDGTVVALNAAGRRLWEALQAGCTLGDLISACVRDGDLPEATARASIARVLRSWRALGLINSAPRPGPAIAPAPAATPVVARRVGRAPALDAVYMPGDRPVRVRCDDVVLGGVIDAACRSCRVEGAKVAPACVDVIERDDGLVVKADGVLLAETEASTPNRALARHRCLTALLETARPSRRWLGILHASAVSVGDSCVVFPGARGSGKSTLAAAMVAAGAGFVTDDYAPLDRASGHVWPVPYAPSIKRGSWRAVRRRYPDLDARPVHELAGLQIRYLDLDASRVAPLSRGLAVGALVFPRYKAGAALEQRRMTAAEAFAALCHARSILDRRPEVLEETLRFVERTPAYRLVYGDLDHAVERVRSLCRTA